MKYKTELHCHSKDASGCSHESVEGICEKYLKYGYISAVKDGKFGFLDAAGNVTCPFTYPTEIVRNYGTFATIKNLDGKLIVLSAAVGELPEHYTDVSIPSSYGCRAFVATNDLNQYALIDGRVRHLPGGIDEYLQIVNERAENAQPDSPKPAAGASSGKGSETAGDAPSAPSLSNQELRNLKKSLQSTERKMATLQGKIADAEARLHAADPTDFVALGDIQREIDGFKEQLEELELVWLETSEALEG